MKKIIISVLSLCSLSMFILCCKKSSNSTCKYDAIPSSLILKFSKNSTLLTDSTLVKMKLSYFGGSNKMYVTDFLISTDTANQNKGMIGSRLIGILSADKNIKTYYIEYPNGWANDTLYVDYLPHTLATNCLYVQQTVKFNGQIVSVDNTFYLDSPVYIINKK